MTIFSTEREVLCHQLQRTTSLRSCKRLERERAPSREWSALRARFEIE